MTTQDPLPLEKLPEYIKTHRNISSVVDMGKIVVIRNNWPKVIVYASAVCMLLGVVSATFITMSPKDITVVIAAKNSSPDFIANIVSVGGGKVVSVKQTKDDTYEVKLVLRKNVNSFLDFLRKNKDFKRVELGNSS